MQDDQSTVHGARRPAPVVARELGDDVKLLIQQEIALAKLEVLGAVKRVGAAIGVFIVAALLGLYLLGFLLGTVARGLETAMSPWAAWLATSGIILALMAILALVGKALIPDSMSPDAATEEAQSTVAVVKQRAQQTAQAFRAGQSNPRSQRGNDDG